MKRKYVKKESRYRLLIFLTALFMGALFVRWLAIFQAPVIANDVILYIKAAKLYAGGSYYDALRVCPFSLFPLLIPPFYMIFGDWVMAGQWVSILCGALTILPLYLLARRIFDAKIALWSSLFYIVCPPLVIFSAEILRDTPFILFYITALWLGYTGIKDEKMGYAALAGISIFFALLIRKEGIPLFIILPLFLIWRIIKEKISWTKATLILTILLLFCLGGFFIVTSVSSKIGGLTPLSSARLQDIKATFTGSTVMQDIQKEIDEKDISLYGKNLFQLAKNYRFLLYSIDIVNKSIKAFSVSLFLLFLFGFIRRKKILHRPDEFLLVAIYVIFFTAFLIHLDKTNYFTTRYAFPVVVPSLIWSGIGFIELRERIIGWMKHTALPWKHFVLRRMTPLLLSVICVPLLAMALMPQREDKLELKEIGLWLKAHGYARSVIVGQSDFARLAFYDDGDFIELPKGTYQSILQFARQNKANLLVINKKTIDQFSPHFFEQVSRENLQRIDIPGINTPKYGTIIFIVTKVGREIS